MEIEPKGPKRDMSRLMIMESDFCLLEDDNADNSGADQCLFICKRQLIRRNISMCNPFSPHEEIEKIGIVHFAYGGMMKSYENAISSANKKREFELVSLLKVCAKIKDSHRGAKLHADIRKRGLLEKSSFLASSLISMYAKCGILAKAHQVLEELPIRDAISWSALIAGYVQHRQSHEALNCFEQMQCEGLFPDSITFACILKACGSIGYLEKGKQIHDEIVNRSLLKKDIVLGNALIDMYVKCGLLIEAWKVLKELSVRDVISWSTLIAGYVEEGQFCDALSCFEQMQRDGLFPNAITFTCVLKACGSIGTVEKGNKIHCEVVRKGLLKKDTFLGNALVDMYAKCGFLARAHQVLKELPNRGVVSWSALVTGYAEWGRCDEALKCFREMQIEGHSPNTITFVSILKACGMVGAINEGKHIHREIVNRGLLETDPVIGNALVDMYAKCGMLMKAKEVIEDLPIQTVVSWNALITGHAQQRQCNEALNCYRRMRSEGLSPDIITFICIVNVCGSIGALDKGEEIHKDIVSNGLPENDIVLGTALVDMYAKCGAIAKAQEMFNKLPVRNVVCWSALITGYAQHGQADHALNCFRLMKKEGLSPDMVTFICLLKACGSMGSLDKGKEIHGEILERGLLWNDVVLGNALVDMYAKCGVLAKAREVLEELPIRDVVSWSALIAGYTHHGQCREALNCFELMQSEGLSPNTVTFICVLKACGSTGSVEKGKQIHDEIVSRGLLEQDPVLGTALLDMYAKCGALARSQQLLEELPIRDVISWNALITGYAQHGQTQEVMSSLEHMQSEGVSPDHITFLSVMCVCNHSGLLDDAHILSLNMPGECEFILKLEHQTCMVMALGCAGQFDDAISLIKVLPADYPAGWLALLESCRKWGNVKLGRSAFESVVQLDRNCSAAYALMENIFAAAGMLEDAEKIASMRPKHGQQELEFENAGFPSTMFTNDIG